MKKFKKLINAIIYSNENDLNQSLNNKESNYTVSEKTSSDLMKQNNELIQNMNKLLDSFNGLQYFYNLFPFETIKYDLIKSISHI